MNPSHILERLRYSGSKLAGLLAYKLHPPRRLGVCVTWQDGHVVGRSFREDRGTTSFTFYREDKPRLLVKRITVSSLATGWGVLALFRNGAPVLFRSEWVNEACYQAAPLNLLGPLTLVLLSPTALRELQAANKSCDFAPFRIG